MKLESYLRLPRGVANRTDLTATAKLVIAALQGRSWGEKVESWASVATMARDIGESAKSVRRAVKLLEEKGLVKVERRKDPDNAALNITNLYTLTESARGTDKMGVHYGQNDHRGTDSLGGKIDNLNDIRNEVPNGKDSCVSLRENAGRVFDVTVYALRAVNAMTADDSDKLQSVFQDVIAITSGMNQTERNNYLVEFNRLRSKMYHERKEETNDARREGKPGDTATAITPDSGDSAFG